jgi:hypothetical protein
MDGSTRVTGRSEQAKGLHLIDDDDDDYDDI